jgi:tetratricopeptide (TPR) repeat protein
MSLRAKSPLIQTFLLTSVLITVLTAAPLRAQSTENADSDIKAADKAFEEKRFQEALRLYQKANSAAGFYGSGMVNELLNKPELALKDYVRALELDKTHYSALENLAGICERTGKTKEAIIAYKAALELDPGPEWQENLRVWIKILESRLRPAERSAVGCWNLANTKLIEGKTEEAENLFSRALRYNPEMCQALYSRGLLKLEKNDTAGAIADLVDAVTICPKLRGGFVHLGLAHEKACDVDRAKAAYTEGTRQDCRDPENWLNLARIYENDKDYERATDMYSQALQLRIKPVRKREVMDRLSAMGSIPINRRKKTPSAPTKRELW